jgi:DNA topoisomerase-3
MYLVLTEKPDQAREISEYLSNSKKQGRAYTGKFYNQDLVVFPLTGHIIGIPTDLSNHCDCFDKKDWTKGFDKLPFTPDENSFYKREVSYDKRKIYNELKSWIAKCDKIIIATDPDIEGAVLGYEPLMFLKALNKVVDYIDMSSINLVDKMLKNAIDGKKSHLDFTNMAYQGLIRADFNYGIGLNISRYLMVKTNFKTTFGIQQTRLLDVINILDVINKRTNEFNNFDRKKYYNIKVKTEYGDFVVDLDDEIKFDKNKVIKIAKEIEEIGSFKITKITKKEKEEEPLKWYDGSDLAQEVSKILKVSPFALLDEKTGIFEKMYLNKIMTYPRTDSKGMMPLSQLELQKEIAKAYINLIPEAKNVVDLNLVKKKVWYEDGKIQVNHTPYTIASPEIDVKSLNKDEKIVFMTAHITNPLINRQYLNLF